MLRAWLIPFPEAIDIRWYPLAGDPERGIVAVSVPRQPRDRWPCIVGKVIDDSDRRRGVSVAYVERYGEHAVEWTAADFQRLLREGTRADLVSEQFDALSSRLDTLTDLVHKSAEQVPAPGPSEAARSFRDRLPEATIAGGLQGASVYALAAAPVDTIALPALFKGSKEALPRLLADPPRLRGGGWDMTVRGDLAVVEGRLRRAVAPDVKVLECWPDGTLIHAAELSYLCWGPKTKKEVRRVNPMALAESALLFARLAEQVYAEHAKPTPRTVRFCIALRGLGAGAPVELSTGGIKSAGYLFDINVRRAPRHDAEFIIDVETPWGPDAVAYELVRGLYTWFGHTEDGIPYAVEENGVRTISAARIIADVG